VVEEKDPRTGRKRESQIFPRYHQLDVVRKLLADSQKSGAGRRYLIQHSAGSGKSNSIAWLAHQLVGLLTDHTELFKQFQDNAAFKKWLGDTNFAVTYKASETGAEGQAPSR
jgi:type I site-specific restriction-modification system R (restriction) subunit